MMPDYVEKYWQSRGLTGPWRICGIDKDGFNGAVVIPALAESESLGATLRSLAQNPPDLLAHFLILVVVNNRNHSPPSEKVDNEHTLRKLAGPCSFLDIPTLGWVDASSPGLELPLKGGGVGLARKIGFDLALPRLNYAQSSPLLISLDADTLVRPDYLPALARHFKEAEASGAVIPFCHQPGATPEQDRAIRRYELFLRAYVLGLHGSKSPYAFHTVGSAMACSAGAYARMGGMNTRVAAEDFYFLQQLARTGGVGPLQGTVVYPSARASNRVPFGTGRSIAKLLANEKSGVLFDRTECFQILGDWLYLVSQNEEEGGEKIMALAAKISVHLSDYLNSIRFPVIWEKLKKNFKSRSKLRAGFHEWFDGLKTMKLIHHLSAHAFPRSEPEKVGPALLQWAGLSPLKGIDEHLTLLRQIQIGEDY